jgi:Fe-S cluster assembly protein SufD
MNIENESFLALNAALHFQNLRLIFDSNKKSKLEIIHIITGKSRLSNPRINIQLQPFAEVEIIEKVIDLGSAENNTLYNISTNAIVDNDAKLEIHKVQSQLKSSSKIVDSLKVFLKENSSAYVNTFSITAGITRNNIYTVLSGEGGYFDVKGLSLLDNSEHVDNRTIIEHAAPNCNSNQLYKGVFNGNSTGVFNGKIVVKQDAQKTNAFQSNKNLLISKDASIYTKPQLEIFADDVKCSHGATSSQPDENALFYLKSRGINPATAKAMLTYAFANEITDNLTNEEVKTFISHQIAQKLGLDWI